MAERHGLRDWSDERVMMSLSGDVERLYVRIRQKVDNYGRFYGDAVLVLCHCLPGVRNADEASVEGWLDELERVGLLVRYDVGGAVFLALVDWDGRVRGKAVFPERIGEAAGWLPRSDDAGAGGGGGEDVPVAVVDGCEEGGSACDDGVLALGCGSRRVDAVSPSSPVPLHPLNPSIPALSHGCACDAQGADAAVCGEDVGSGVDSGGGEGSAVFVAENSGVSDEGEMLSFVNARKEREFRRLRGGGEFAGGSAPPSVAAVVEVMKSSLFWRKEDEARCLRSAEECFHHYCDGYTAGGGLVKSWPRKALKWLEDDARKWAAEVRKGRGKGRQRTRYDEEVALEPDCL